VLKEGKEVLCEETLTTAGEQTKTILTRKNRFVDSKGNYFLVGVIHDITERKHIEEKLKLVAGVFSHSREAISITDASTTIVDVNDAFVRITGFSRSEAIGQNPSFQQYGRQSAEFYQTMWEGLLKNGYWCGEVWNRRKNGEVYTQAT
jgi:PAS domain S-box-containing protein